MAKITMNLN